MRPVVQPLYFGGLVKRAVADLDSRSRLPLNGKLDRGRAGKCSLMSKSGGLSSFFVLMPPSADELGHSSGHSVRIVINMHPYLSRDRQSRGQTNEQPTDLRRRTAGSTLRHAGVSTVFLTLQEAVIAWHHLLRADGRLGQVLCSAGRR